MTITIADPYPTGELPRVTRSIPEQRYQPRTATPPAPVPAEPIDSPLRLVIERAQGDGPDAVRAMAELYQRYVDTVFRFVYFRVGNRPLAEDLTSDTFVRAMRRIRSFEWTGKDIGAWLVTIARNLVADYYKSGRYRLEVTTADVLDADRPAVGHGDDPCVIVGNIIESAQLAAAVKMLNAEQRECIELRFFAGLSVRETADQMGKNEGAIKALQYRAVRSLARILPAGLGGDHVA